MGSEKSVVVVRACWLCERMRVEVRSKHGPRSSETLGDGNQVLGSWGVAGQGQGSLHGTIMNPLPSTLPWHI